MEKIWALLFWLLLCLLGLSLFLLFLSLFPVKVKLALENGSQRIDIGFLFFHFHIGGEKKTKKIHKSNKKQIKETKKKQSEEDIKKLEMRFFEKYEELKILLRQGGKSMRRLLKGLHVSKVRLFISLGTDNASTTGIAYGALCAAVSSEIYFLDSLFFMEYDEVHLVPNFYKEEFRWQASCVIWARVIVLLFIALQLGFFLYKRKKRANKTTKEK